MSTSESPTSNIQESEAKTIEIPHSSFVSSVAFLADGRYFVGGGYDGHIRRWRVEDGQQVGGPMNARDGILTVATSRDGKWVVSGTDTGLVTIWNAETHSKVMGFKPHSAFPVEALDVSPDGTRIATGSHDSTACVWSFSTGERLLGPLQHDHTLAAVKYSHDGRFLATATCENHSVRIYNSEDGRLFVNLPVRVDAFDQSLAWSRNSRHLFALSDGHIKCLDMWTGTTLSEWPIHSNNDPRGITLLPNNGRFIAASANSSVSFWDTTTHKQIGPVLEHADVLFSMAISSNYDIVTSGVKSTILRGLRGILPSRYCDDVPSEPDILHLEGDPTNLEETIKSLCAEIRNLRAEHESSHKTIMKLEDTIQELRAELAKSQRKADEENNKLNMAIESLRSDLRSWTTT